jgi:hypothetical protein
MRLNHIETKAKHLIVDVFIFLEEENRFYFIDDIEKFDEYVILYFEPSFSEEIELKLENDEPVKIISEYEINTKMLKKDLKETFNGDGFEALEITVYSNDENP